MNERIAELKAQCVSREMRGTNAFDSYMVDIFNTEKFAELIIQECLNICEDMGDNGMDGHYCADKISKTLLRQTCTN
jgi:hypothetical protein